MRKALVNTNSHAIMITITGTNNKFDGITPKEIRLTETESFICLF